VYNLSTLINFLTDSVSLAIDDNTIDGLGTLHCGKRVAVILDKDNNKRLDLSTSNLFSYDSVTGNLII
jgi:hypothetical protein